MIGPCMAVRSSHGRETEGGRGGVGPRVQPGIAAAFMALLVLLTWHSLNWQCLVFTPLVIWSHRWQLACAVVVVCARNSFHCDMV